MNTLSRFYQWLGLRTEEARVLWLSFSGAFLVMAFLVLSRSLREALYLGAFNVKTLPILTLTSVLLGFPVAAAFSYFLARKYAQSVMKRVTLLGMAGLIVLWPVTHLREWVILFFYLWTALLSIVLTSGLWLTIAEHFQVREAKRLYGWVSAGGTLGTMLMGSLLVPLAKKVSIFKLIPILIALLALFYAVLLFLPKPGAIPSPRDTEKEGRVSFTEGIRLILSSPYLSAIAMIVFSATLASTLLDYQFKEFVQHSLKAKEAMAGFFGGFYGWAGGFALFVQIVVTSRLLGKAGIGRTLAVLPFILVCGSSAMFVFPSFILATGVRGLDQSLRKSLHRSAIEILYVPLPASLRKKTKTFIDSVLDSVAEGVGAIIIFILVSLGTISSRYLSILIFLFSLALLVRALMMNRIYFGTLVKRLKEEGEVLAKEERDFTGGDLLDASFSSIDIKGTLDKKSIVFKKLSPKSQEPAPECPIRPSNLSLEGKTIPDLLKLLVRDDACGEVGETLVKRGEEAVPLLVEHLLDENADFVVRRRIPRILAKIPSAAAGEGLLDALLTQRFEIRYRAAIALMKRLQSGFVKVPEEKRKEMIWEAIRFEVHRDRPIWEMQSILDTLDESERDDFPERQLEVRGQLSLEHVFRMLSLIFDAKLILTAYRALASDHEKAKGYSLEYLEHILPEDIREKLWLFIGDITDYQKQKEMRPLEEVADELLKTGATFIVDKKTQQELLVALENREDKKTEGE